MRKNKVDHIFLALLGEIVSRGTNGNLFARLASPKPGLLIHKRGSNIITPPKVNIAPTRKSRVNNEPMGKGERGVNILDYINK